MNTSFETTFTVMPSDANCMTPLVFGGMFFSHMDLCAAQTVNRFLYDSTQAQTAVTHKAEVTFHKPSYVGDLIFLKGEITGTRHKAITVKVMAMREKPGSPERDLVAEGTFVFVAIKNQKSIGEKPDMLPYVQHGLSL